MKNVGREGFPAGPRNWSSWERIRNSYFLFIAKQNELIIP